MRVNTHFENVWHLVSKFQVLLSKLRYTYLTSQAAFDCIQPWSSPQAVIHSSAHTATYSISITFFFFFGHILERKTLAVLLQGTDIHKLDLSPP